MAEPLKIANGFVTKCGNSIGIYIVAYVKKVTISLFYKLIHHTAQKRSPLDDDAKSNISP